MGKLPPRFPGPWILLSFTGTFRSAGPENGTSQIGADLDVYGGTERQLKISGTGENAAAAVCEALRPLCGSSLSFSRTALNGYGNRIRLYTEITLQPGMTYALERIGPSAAELLLLCGLDAVNAGALKAMQ
jgi:hypothetical protein